MKQLFILVVTAFQILCSNSYSLLYFYDEEIPKIHNTGAYFKESPNAEQVADICSRLTGNNPILKEDYINLPYIDIFGKNPLIVELVGNDIDVSSSQEVIISMDESIIGPNLESVIDILNKHGVAIENKKISNSEELSLVLQENNRPIVILKHSFPLEYSRKLISSVEPLTEFQISQYQIVLWTTVGILLVLFGAISSIVNMEVIPDSLLYAKFQSSRTGKND